MIKQQIISGFTFGIAGLLAAVSIMLFFQLFGDTATFIIYVALPAAAAAASGAWIGAAIMDETKIRTGLRAAGQGALVALLSQALFWAAYSIIGVFMGASGGLLSGLGILAIIAIGTFWTLGFSLIVGALAGSILYKLR